MPLQQLGVAAVFAHRGEPRRPHAKIPEFEQMFAAGAAALQASTVTLSPKSSLLARH
jgi:hypothetical protein